MPRMNVKERKTEVGSYFGRMPKTKRKRQVSTKHIRCKSKAYYIGAQEKKEAEADLREPNV